jgi:hypothetical protein
MPYKKTGEWIPTVPPGGKEYNQYGEEIRKKYHSPKDAGGGGGYWLVGLIVILIVLALMSC